MFFQIIKEQYEDLGIPFDEITKKKCSEKRCGITGNLSDYLILDGDEIEKRMENKKSADGILIDKKNIEDMQTNIIICELGSNKNFKDMKEKLQNPGKHIVGIVNTCEMDINDVKCCFLGKYKNSKRYKKLLKNPTVNIPGIDKFNIVIKNYSCGTNIDFLVNN